MRKPVKIQNFDSYYGGIITFQIGLEKDGLIPIEISIPDTERVNNYVQARTTLAKITGLLTDVLSARIWKGIKVPDDFWDKRIAIMWVPSDWVEAIEQ